MSAKEIIDVNKFEKRMLDEIKKWRKQREENQKAYDEAINPFIKEKL